MPLFESHVTVADIIADDFIAICKSLATKPVIIDHDTGSGVIQMMTAKFHNCEQPQALSEMHAIAASFPSVIRRKLEVITRGDYSCLYYETHIKFKLREGQVPAFVRCIESLGGHTSINRLKQPDSGLYYFATFRGRWVPPGLRDTDFELVNTIRECVVYDDNQGLDTNWVCDCGIKQLIDS